MILALVSVVTISCNKDDDDPIAAVNPHTTASLNLVGTWAFTAIKLDSPYDAIDVFAAAKPCDLDDKTTFAIDGKERFS